MRTRMRDHALATAALVLAVLVRWLLDPLLGNSMPLATAFAAVAAASGRPAGFPPAVVAIVGYCAFSYLFIPPRHTLLFGTVRAWWRCSRIS